MGKKSTRENKSRLQLSREEAGWGMSYGLAKKTCEDMGMRLPNLYEANAIIDAVNEGLVSGISAADISEAETPLILRASCSCVYPAPVRALLIRAPTFFPIVFSFFIYVLL